MPSSTVMAISEWPTNAELIADCAQLGYLRREWLTLDPTHNKGTFWKKWQPEALMRHDIIAKYSDGGVAVDFTDLPYPDRFFDAVVFDPPYKLNGTPTEEVDEPYGVHERRTWQQRMALCREGLTECARVLGDGFLLMKCQDQVSSGKVRWQTYEFTKHAESLGLGLVDRLDRLGYRKQPEGRRQVHAARNCSTMLVFKRGWHSSDVPKSVFTLRPIIDCKLNTWCEDFNGHDGGCWEW